MKTMFKEPYPGDAVGPTDEDLLTDDKGHGHEVNNLEHVHRVAVAVGDVIGVLRRSNILTDQEKKTVLKIVLKNI